MVTFMELLFIKDLSRSRVFELPRPEVEVMTLCSEKFFVLSSFYDLAVGYILNSQLSSLSSSQTCLSL